MRILLGKVGEKLGDQMYGTTSSWSFLSSRVVAAGNCPGSMYRSSGDGDRLGRVDAVELALLGVWPWSRSMTNMLSVGGSVQ